MERRGNVLGQIKSFLFIKIPEDIRPAFAADAAQKNNFRFSIVPIFFILTQISYYLYNLIVSPETFLDESHLDLVFFTIFSFSYVVLNALFLGFFNKARREKDYSPDGVRRSHILLLVFLLSYVLFEGFEAMLEVEIAGSIYHFLTIFFMTAFLPVLKRREKFVVLTLFLITTELGFTYLESQGYAAPNTFQGVAILFYFVFLFFSFISYNSGVHSFMLKQELIIKNENLRSANERLEHLSAIDPLTGLANRRAFDQYTALVWRKGYQDKDMVSVIMFDIDDFKRYNDTYGHQMGDVCLKRVSNCIDSVFKRETDMVARYGGEEFIVLAVSESIDDMEMLAERIREKVESMNIKNEKSETGEYVTISAGVAAVVPSSEMRYEDVIRLADDALYQAKSEGKNRVSRAE